jgi:hypothetical protein
MHDGRAANPTWALVSGLPAAYDRPASLVLAEINRYILAVAGMRPPANNDFNDDGILNRSCRLQSQGDPDESAEIPRCGLRGSVRAARHQPHG